MKELDAVIVRCDKSCRCFCLVSSRVNRVCGLDYDDLRLPLSLPKTRAPGRQIDPEICETVFF